MSEKILGFKKSDWLGVKIGISPRTDTRKDLNKLQKKQVPVVSLQALRKQCDKLHQRHTVDLADDIWSFTKGYNKALEDLLSWAKKEAKK